MFTGGSHKTAYVILGYMNNILTNLKTRDKSKSQRYTLCDKVT